MVPLAGFIDTAFLGHLSDLRHLNGVALATVLFNVIYWSFNCFRMGTTGPTAQAVGEGEEHLLWLILVRNLLLAGLIGSGVWCLRGPIADVGFMLLSASAPVKAAALDFFRGRIGDAPAVLMNYVLLGWLLGRGQGRQVMLLSAVVNLSNIVLDYWFIRQRGWGSYGAGLATALSQYVMLAVGIGLLWLEGIPWQLWHRIRLLIFQAAALKELFSLNRDILIRTFALVMAMSSFTQISAQLGDTILGVNTLLMQVVLMSAYFMDGIALAVESYAGRFYGQQAFEHLRGLWRLGGALSVSLGCAIALSLWLWPMTFFRLLTSHPTLLSQIPQYVLWLLPVLGLGGIAFTLDGYFLGLTQGSTLRNATLLAVLAGYLPLAIAAHWLEQPQLLWLALSGLMGMRALTLGRQVSHTFQQAPFSS